MEIFNQITIEYPKDLHAARFAFGDQLTIDMLSPSKRRMKED
jgi:hypothetical protein